MTCCQTMNGMETAMAKWSGGLPSSPTEEALHGFLRPIPVSKGFFPLESREETSSKVSNSEVGREEGVTRQTLRASSRGGC